MNAPVAVPAAVDAFDRDRQRFLHALGRFLDAPDVSDDLKRAELDGTTNAVTQLAYLAGAEG